MLGVIAFILTLLVLVLVHEWGHFAAARWFKIGVEEFGFGFPPALFKKKFGETTYSFNWIPLGGFVRIKGEDEADQGPDSFASRPVYQRATVIAAGVIMNIVTAVVLLTVGYAVGIPQELTDTVPAGARIESVQHQIVAVLPEGPGAAALQAGDRVLSINDQTFRTLTELQQYIRSRDGQTVQIIVERGDQSQTIQLQPRVWREGQPAGLGIQLFSSGTVSYPWYQAPVAAVRATAGMFTLIASTLWDAAAGALRGQSTGVDIAGPIGIAVITNEVIGLGWATLLVFVATLSVNLAFVNILPIPALDGGRLLFVLIEAVRRRPVSKAFEAALHRWGFVLLLGLVIVVTVLDLKRFSGFFTNLLQ